MEVISATARACPLCGEPGHPDGRRPVEVAGLAFESLACERTGELPGSSPDLDNAMPGHVFPERWLEGRATGSDELMAFTKAFAYVRPPFEPGSALDEAFGDRDARLAWVQHTEPGPDGHVRVLIRM